LLIAAWGLPAVHVAFAFLLMNPIGGLDENGEPYKPTPFLRKVIAFPLALGLLVVFWPCVLWSEHRHSRR